VTIFGFTHCTGNVPILHYPYLFCIMQYSDHAHICFMHKQNPHSFTLMWGLLRFGPIIFSNKNTVEPPITDPPTSGQPLYSGHWLWHQMKLLQN